MAEIHPRLQTPDRRFVLLGSAGENLKIPFEKEWQETANYQFDDPKLLAHRGNHGICGGHGDLHIIDCDALNRWQELAVLPLIPATLTVESRPGHRQYYLVCKEHFQSGGLFDPEKTEVNEAGKPEYIHIGDIKAGAKDGICGGQAVGPGCKHPSGSIYQVVVDAPIAEVSGEHLQTIISRFKTSKKVNSNYQRAEEQTKNAKKRRYEEKDPLDVMQVVDIMPPAGEISRSGDELRGDHPVHGSTNGGNYVINTAKNVWHCKRCESGGGVAAAIAVKHGLISCSAAGAGELRGDLFKQALKIAKEKYGMTGNGNPGGQKAEGPTPGEILERIGAEPRALKDLAILAALVALKAHDPIEYDLLLVSIKKAGTGIKIATINELVDKYILESKKATEELGVASDILTEANRILDEGRGFEYVYQVWQKRHHGDENLGKGLFLSIGAQSCESSKGVHVHACGPRGSGKSDGAEKASEAIPGSHLLVGSASPKALYYLGEQLPAGAVVYLDDIGWNDQAAQMFKTCTTFYREGATHTVVVDQEIRQFRTAPRIIFWLTTADDQTDEQIRDRLLRIDTTETAKHTKEVIDFIFQQRKSGAASFDTREIEVCRAIIYLLKQIFIDVVIPFTDNIRFEGDPRGATIFADLVSSFAIWRHRKRAHDSTGAIIAAYEDYKDAEVFFNAIKGHGDTKYTPRELRVLQAIKNLHGEATREIVMAKTGLSKGDLSDILNGRSRDGQAKYGLFHKCAALTEDEEGTSIQLEDIKRTRTSIKKKILRLPNDYDTLSAYGKAVYLADETTIKRTCSASSEQFDTSSEIKTEFGKDIVRKFVKYNIIREKRTTGPHPLWRAPDFSIKNISLSSLSPGAKYAELPNSKPLDNDLPFRTTAEPMPNQVRTKPLDNDPELPNYMVEEQANAAPTMGPNPRKAEPTPTTKIKTIPFKPRFHDFILNGSKTETRRSPGWVRTIGGLRVGDVVKANFGAALRIMEVREERLGDITPESVKAEGCQDLSDFKKVWDQIHPGGWKDDAPVVLIRFELADGAKSEEPTGAEPTPATKARLWDSIGLKLKKVGRKDKARYGLAVSDLSPGELELITAAGWQQETTESGISILWAPAKAARALAVPA